ncbi:RusA family crossover junction endodeoxyribonuclease [Cronobacter sakazakii]|uniref:RusA family crossover junction endodeoxyribonuclease n=1 Tax=Cronobacter sakazakii TaxID=28141 RepID=UPI001A361749|nr:RusA family crossover junction endodeoxyribonuclease [Cronobacter sakazakii]EMC4229590.1 RusA family crossover junction endodeoxyribonuclease [Cronobacter sakazakii]EMC4348242.1 RusA family crossover junction endodeoxyribonuclease [Cronobacter sakazakii]EME2006751.1 RusA family crossover junction endodeoxyribonuclease [Cronobacter sakazakii]MEB8577608.1 RusA family crossover junction endodeoxyribonuclease [Cronobacter sakazakii]HAU5462722.1 RusA family crossover junction endodeoxyribonuclea
MTNTYEFCLPFPPSVNTYWRRRGMQYFIAPKGREYRRAVIEIIRQQGLDNKSKARMKIKIIADVPDRRRRDLDNLLKAVCDSLEHAGFVLDDNQFDEIHLKRGEVIPGGRLGIKVTEIEQ